MDLPAVEADLENTKNGLLSLGVEESEIVIVRDPSHGDLSVLVREYDLMIGNNHSAKKRTLLFVYYAGHGIIKGATKAVCNQGE